jgi:PAS domain S-box-containing protein
MSLTSSSNLQKIKEMTEALTKDEFTLILKSKKEYEIAHDALSFGMVLIDKEDNIIKCNKAFAELFDLSPKDLYKKNVKSIHAIMQSDVLELILACGAIEETAEELMFDAHLNKWVYFSVSPFYDLGNEFTGAVFSIIDMDRLIKRMQKMDQGENTLDLDLPEDFFD